MTPEEIKALRHELGLSQQAFADTIGCHKRTVAWWEAGRSHPTGLYAQALAKIARTAKRPRPP